MIKLVEAGGGEISAAREINPTTKFLYWAWLWLDNLNP